MTAADAPTLPEIDFYILSEPGEESTLRFACRLAEKAWRQGMKIYVHTASVEQARRLDELLWTFRQDSFVPHEQWDGHGPPGAPILIGLPNAEPPDAGLLINLGDEIPAWFERCARIAELVGPESQRRSVGRARYRQYRDAGADLRSHEI